MAQRWQCFMCAFLCLYLSELISHLNSAHRNDSGFHRQCGLPNCPSDKEYTSTNSLVKHVRMKHSSLLHCTYEDVFPVNVTEGRENNVAGKA